MAKEKGGGKSKKKEEKGTHSNNGIPSHYLERREAEEAMLRAEEGTRHRVLYLPESRLAEIRAKKEREIREQKEREALEQLFKQVGELFVYISQESERLLKEEADLKELNQMKSSQLVTLQYEREEEFNWRQHLTCSRLPDSRVERDVNTYISLLEEESVVIEGDPSYSKLLDLLPSILELTKGLENRMCQEIDEQNSKEASRLRAQLRHVSKATMEKFDKLTAYIIQRIDHFSREANENFQLEVSGSNFHLGLWGNVTKNPRFKIIDFPDIKVSASLPKPLALSNVAVRMLINSNNGISTIYEEPHLDSKLHMSPVGGVLLLDLVELPDLPKAIDSWTIRQSKIFTCLTHLSSSFITKRRPVSRRVPISEKIVSRRSK